MKILTVVGARPQFIKAAMFAKAIIRAAANRPGDLDEQIIHTGQHYDFEMSASFFRELDIPDPLANLDIHGGTHGQMTGAMLPLLEREIMEREPTVVVVIGDTNSTLAGALAAAKLNVPIAHIEAGMRHYKRDIPEEINRVVTDHLCEFLFCSSDFALQCLKKEGIVDGVFVTGDLSYDLFLCQRNKRIPFSYNKRYVACTIHRAANTDDERRLRSIFAALAKCPYTIILPLHPRTRRAIDRFGMSVPSNIEILPPLESGRMLGLIERCEFVITDSGGLQKEAYFSGKRCITLSEVSPWQELIDLDADRLVGAETDTIVKAYGWAEQPLDATVQPYGDGTAAKQMVSILIDRLG